MKHRMKKNKYDYFCDKKLQNLATQNAFMDVTFNGLCPNDYGMMGDPHGHDRSNV